MIAIGIGCRKGTAKEAITALIREACTLAALDYRAATLFSAEFKQGEEGLIAAAGELGIGLRFLPVDRLQAVEGGINTRSRHSAETFGIGSVSEAAALAGAGPGARMLLPRIVGEGTTCAIALGGDP